MIRGRRLLLGGTVPRGYCPATHYGNEDRSHPHSPEKHKQIITPLYRLNNNIKYVTKSRQKENRGEFRAPYIILFEKFRQTAKKHFEAQIDRLLCEKAVEFGSKRQRNRAIRRQKASEADKKRRAITPAHDIATPSARLGKSPQMRTDFDNNYLHSSSVGAPSRS